MTLMMTGKGKKFEVENATAIIREALVKFNICYLPKGIQKAHGSKIQDSSVLLNKSYDSSMISLLNIFQ